MRILQLAILIFVFKLGFSNNIDSLKNLTFNSSDEELIELYKEIAIIYSKTNFDSSELYCNKLIQLSENINVPTGKASALKTLGNVYFFKGDLDMAKSYYEQSIDTYSSVNDYEQVGNLYNNLSSIELTKGNYDKAFKLLNHATSAYEHTNKEYLKIKPLINFGYINIRQGNFGIAEMYYIQALDLAKEHNDTDNTANILVNLGALHKEIGNYPKALNYYRQVIELNSNSGKHREMAAAYNNIGAIYRELGDYTKAIENISTAYEIRKKHEAYEALGYSLINLGDIYLEWNKTDIALDYYHDAIDLQNKTKNSGIISSAMIGIGNVYYKNEMFTKALDYYFEAAGIIKEQKEKTDLAKIYQQIGETYCIRLNKNAVGQKYLNEAAKIYSEKDLKSGLAQIDIIHGLYRIKQQEVKEAIKHFEQSLAYNALNFNQQLKVHKQLADAYTILQNYKKANTHLQHVLNYKDSIHFKGNKIQWYLFETKMNSNYKEQENTYAKEKKQIISNQLSFRNNLLITISIFALLLIVLLAILIVNLKNVKKSKHKIINSQKEISQQKELLEEANAQLLKAKIEAEKHNEFKSEFLANVGHELRTPLNAIIGYSKLMHNNMPKECDVKHLDNIIQASDNLLVIINELLDFSKIEAGKMLVDKTPFKPVNVISQAISALKIYAEEKSNTLEIHIDPEMPQYVFGDQKHLSHILTNVINNAIKFSYINTPISIDAHCSKEGTNCILTFKITDRGIGIHESEYDTIFESFIQVKNNMNKKYSGTGLGLAIVKRLVDLQEGQVSVKSSENTGTIFTIQIPYKIINEPITKTSESKSTPKTEDQVQGEIKILLVEDNEINQELAKDTILSWGGNYRVEIAENGKEAIVKLNESDFDLILMDIQMPEMDGHEATLYIRNNMGSIGEAIPIIGMTAHALQSEKDLALKNGMNDYIIKPFNPDNLKQIIIKSVFKT